MRNPLKWLWDKYRHTVNPLPDPPKHDRTERVKRQIRAEIESRPDGKVLLLRRPGQMHKVINGNAILDELARADRESRIILDPEKVKQITDTGRSNRA